MNNYTAQDLYEWVNPYLYKMQYVMVIHTNFRPHDNYLGTINAQRQRRSEFLESALKNVSRHLYKDDPKLPFRNRHLFAPIRFATVENTSPDLTQEQTLHFNVLIGRIPETMTKDQMTEIFLQSWVNVHRQSKDVWVKHVSELEQTIENEAPIRTFTKYMLKDAYRDKTKAWGTYGVLDQKNTWLPPDALNLK